MSGKISVLDNGKWDVRKTLLAALEQCDDWDAVVVVGQRDAGDEVTDFPNIIGGETDTGVLLCFAETVRRRALRGFTYEG